MLKIKGQFWKDCKIMNIIDNIRAAWSEVTPNCLQGVWKRLWPEACSNLEEAEEEAIISNIVEVANEAEMEGVNEGNV
jgi:hypothetical protein